MLRKELLVLYFGFQDKRTGIWPKLTAAAAIIYLISPIDLVPDFIPFFGWLDDLVLVPLMLNFAIQLLPMDVREESLVRTFRMTKKIRFLTSIVVIVLIAFVFFFLVRPLINK